MDKDSSSLDPDLIEILKGLESHKGEYPPELLAARRASFMEQVARRTGIVNEEGLSSEDEQVLAFLGELKTSESEYPAELLTARRSMFRRQVKQIKRISVWDVFASRIREIFSHRFPRPRISALKMFQTSLKVAAFALAASAGLALYAGQSALLSAPENQITPVGHAFQTPTPKTEILCKDGFEPPLCLAREIDKSHDLSNPGNGRARPAVAKDTMPGYGRLHRAENINDGLYGPGASWVSNSPNSWIKIDLGQVTIMNTIAFGRDRLGNYNDGDPGRFVIAVAESDDVYANGNSSNDEKEYDEVYDSADDGFDGMISGPETVIAQFRMTEARYIKITFENARTAIDEVEVFVSRPPVLVADPTRVSKEERPSNTALPPSTATRVIPINTATSLPTHTPVITATVVVLPTHTPVLPTQTPFIPTNTPVPLPTGTPVPPPTNTPDPEPTNTPVPPPADTAVPEPTNTAVSFDTQSLRPTNTLLPMPTSEQFPTLPSE